MPEKNKYENAFYNPSEYKNPLMRFLHFLFCKNKLYYRKGDTALCPQCGISIKVPLAYYHWGFRAVLAVLTMIVFEIVLLIKASKLRPIPQVSVFVILYLIFSRIATALVFAWFSWRPLKKQDLMQVLSYEIAEKERLKRERIVLRTIIAMYAVHFVT